MDLANLRAAVLTITDSLISQDVSEADGMLAMMYLAAGVCVMRSQDRGVPISEALRVMRETADAMVALHVNLRAQDGGSLN
jgi:folate-dependent tRNA-U54 methylase TrmFO/GidA